MTARTISAAAIAMVILTTGLAEADEPKVRIELTGSWTDVDPNADSLWAWSIGSFAAFEDTVSGGQGLSFSALRISVPLGRVEVFVGYEREPEFQATSVFLSDPRDFRGRDGKARVQAFDAGVSSSFNLGNRSQITPWVGVSNLRTNMARSTEWEYVWNSNTVVFESTNAHRSENLWGVGYGAEVTVDLNHWLMVPVRVLQRWGAGTMTETYSSEDYQYRHPIEPGDEPIYSEEYGDISSNKTTGSMFGLDLGLRATFARWVSLEAGWRYRNWSYGGGPGDYDGPYLRLALAW